MVKTQYTPRVLLFLTSLEETEYNVFLVFLY